MQFDFKTKPFYAFSVPKIMFPEQESLPNYLREIAITNRLPYFLELK